MREATDPVASLSSLRRRYPDQVLRVGAGLWLPLSPVPRAPRFDFPDQYSRAFAIPLFVLEEVQRTQELLGALHFGNHETDVGLSLGVVLRKEERVELLV